MRQFLVVLLSKFGMLKRHLFYTWVDCLNCWVIKIVEPKKLGPVKRAGGRDPKKGFFIAVGENAMCGTEIDPQKKCSFKNWCEKMVNTNVWKIDVHWPTKITYMGRYPTELDLFLAPTGTGTRNGFINVMPVALSIYHKVTWCDNISSIPLANVRGCALCRCHCLLRDFAARTTSSCHGNKFASWLSQKERQGHALKFWWPTRGYQKTVEKSITLHVYHDFVQTIGHVTFQPCSFARCSIQLQLPQNLMVKKLYSIPILKSTLFWVYPPCLDDLNPRNSHMCMYVYNVYVHTYIYIYISCYIPYYIPILSPWWLVSCPHSFLR